MLIRPLAHQSNTVPLSLPLLDIVHVAPDTHQACALFHVLAGYSCGYPEVSTASRIPLALPVFIT